MRKPPVRHPLPDRTEVDIFDFVRSAGVSVKTVRRGIKDGSVPRPAKRGRKYVWPREIVAGFLGVTTALANGAA